MASWRVGLGVLFALLSSTACGRARSGACLTPPQGSSDAAEVCIPPGEFSMGAPKLPKPAAHPGAHFTAMPRNDWAPGRRVRLSAFYIDAYEATWGRYSQCLQAGLCSDRGLRRFWSTEHALSDPAAAHLPVWGATFDEAVEFCAWSGKRLPTEAEWERAARGPQGTTYPWGNDPPPESLIRSRTFYGSTSLDPSMSPPPVGTNVRDVTPEGVHDLFASVDEWVSDWYSPGYGHGAVEPRNPTGPAHPVFVQELSEYGGANWNNATGGKVVRGDLWNHAGGDGWNLATLGTPGWFREERDPNSGAGIRCARDDRPPGSAPPNGWVFGGSNWTALAPPTGGR